jgi:hypothetical protein
MHKTCDTYKPLVGKFEEKKIQLRRIRCSVENYLKWMRMWNGFEYLRKGPSDGLLRKQY